VAADPQQEASVRSRQNLAHQRASWLPFGNRLKTCLLEHCNRTDKQANGPGMLGLFDRAGLDDAGAILSSVGDGRIQQQVADPLAAPFRLDEKARDRPKARIGRIIPVQRSGDRARSVPTRHVSARRHLHPADGSTCIEGDQARRQSFLRGLFEQLFLLILAQGIAQFRLQPEIAAPAAITGTLRAKQGLRAMATDRL
jgi:hypothetical protein